MKSEIFDLVGKILLTTYTICLPILLAWIREIRKDKKQSQDFIQSSMSTINTSIERLSNKMEFNEAMTSRYRIIRAADEIRNGSELSEDHLEQLGEDIDIYNSYCEKHSDYRNHKGQSSKNLVIDYEQKKLQGKLN